MVIPKIAFFLGAGANVFMGLPTTKHLMDTFISKHQSCSLESMVREYGNKNIEDLYSDVNKLLDLRKNMVLSHIPILCATDEVIGCLEEEKDEYYTPQTPCDEHPLLESLHSESCFESVYDMLDELKHSLGRHVFESLRYNKNKLVEYENILEKLRTVVDSGIIDIITTNYDLLIENYCDNLGLQIIDGFSKMPSGKVEWNGKFDGNDEIKLLKLHGSLNWHKESDGALIRESVEMQYNPTRNIWIEPSPQKIGTEKEPFKTISEEFEKILDTCDLLVVIGFSFHNDIWKNMIKNQLDKEHNKMRMLYVSKSIPSFPSNYGSELIIDKNNNIVYKEIGKKARKTQNKQRVAYFQSEFNTERINDVIKVIERVKSSIQIRLHSPLINLKH